MPSVQGPFRWDGDLANAGIAGLNVALRVSDVRLTEAREGAGAATRTWIDGASAVTVRLFQRRGDKDYTVTLGAAAVLGSEDDPARFLRYLFGRMHKLQSGEGDPADVTLPIRVDLLGSDGETLAGTRLDALMVMKGMYEPANFGVPDVPDDLLNRHPPAGLRARIERDLFLVNQVAYEALVDKISAMAGNAPDYQRLLHIIAYRVDLSGDIPKLAPRQPTLPPVEVYPASPPHVPLTPEQQAIRNILHNLEIEDHEAALQAIEDAFPALFSFPVSTRDVQLQQVAGTIAVKAPAGTAVTAADIARYRISAEFTEPNADGEAELEVVHYDWDAASPVVADGEAAFAFSAVAPIFPVSEEATVTVIVRSADGMVLWSRAYRVGNPALAALRIVVPLAGATTVKPADPPEANIKRLRGQVLDLSRTADLKNVLVAIQARTAAKDWHVVGSASCDPQGNFSMPYPTGVFAAAQAVVSLLPHNPMPIAVRRDAGDGHTIADDFLYLLVREPKLPEKRDDDPDCHCEETVKATRLPEQADLIRSDEYTQDLGAGCLDLSTPNRTLREYSFNAIVRTSDPDVANYSLAKRSDGSFVLTGSNRLLKRSAVSLTNPIRWQDAPDAGDVLSLYQTVSVATGHVLHYRAQFRADGYSLSELLYSLPLAPGQKKQIVIFDSSHALQGAESQQLSVAERLAASLLSDRDVTDTLGGRISEGLQGSSKAETASLSAGLGAAASVGSFGASLGIAGGFSNAASSGGQNGARDISQFFAEKLRHSPTQNADSNCQQNASVVTTVSEDQKYSASTEVVANHNHCHSMTMMYFEVMRHYAIFPELAGVEECVFVPLLMTNFTMENIFKFQDVLAANLLSMPSNAYLPAVNGEHPLARAFDAVTRIRTGYANLDFPEGRYCDEQIGIIEGTFDLTVLIPRPRTQYDRIISLPLVNKQVTHEEFDPIQQAKNFALAPLTFGLSLAGGPAMKTVTETIQVRAQLFDSFMTMQPNYASVPPAQSIRVTNFDDVYVSSFPLVPWLNAPGVGVRIGKERFFDGNELDQRQWEAYAALMGYDDVYKILSTYFKDKLISEWDTIFYREIVPVMFERMIARLSFATSPPDHAAKTAATPPNKYVGIACDFSSRTRYTGGQQRITLNLRASSNLTRAEIPDTLYLQCGTAVARLSDVITFRAENLSLRYSTRHITNTMFSGYLGDGLQDGTMLWMPKTSEDLRYPRREDQVLAAKLIEHLNSNLEHYNKVLWASLDPDRRYLLLDGFNIQIYNDFGEPVGLKSLASVVKNELLAIAGNAMVLPVASGFRVSRSYIVEQTETADVATVRLLDHYKPPTPVEPYRLSVPTRGVYAEAMMGRCDSCEKVQEGTSQDWTKFTTDEPTAINALTAPTPQVTDWKAAYQSLAGPLVALQKAPDDPTPGAGLAGLSAALTNANAFRDVTGLAGNQMNAMETLKQNTQAAAKFAEAAKGLASQMHNTANADNITKSIKEAKASGDINHAEAADLTKKHIEQKIDGGDAAKQKAEAEKAAADARAGKQTLTDAAVSAAGKDKHVVASETDSKGTTRKLQVRPAPTPAVTPTPTPPATEEKRVYKTIYFRSFDCWDEPLAGTFMLTVNDAAIDGVIAAHKIEGLSADSFQVWTTKEAPTFKFGCISAGRRVRRSSRRSPRTASRSKAPRARSQST